MQWFSNQGPQTLAASKTFTAVGEVKMILPIILRYHLTLFLLVEIYIDGAKAIMGRTVGPWHRTRQ